MIIRLTQDDIDTLSAALTFAERANLSYSWDAKQLWFKLFYPQGILPFDAEIPESKTKKTKK